MINEIINDDCFNILPKIDDSFIDLILIDPPYSILNTNYDKEIDFIKLSNQLKRIIKNNGVIAITCNLKLLILLYNLNSDIFRYELIWDKVNNHGNFANIKKMPAYRHEYIIILSLNLNGHFTYNPQKTIGKPYKNKRKTINNEFCSYSKEVHISINDGYRYPISIIKFKSDNRNERGLHPTQKPIALFEYLIRTYSEENDLVLDCFSGSSTTAIACMNTNRRFICIEKDKNYYNISKRRVDNYKLKENKYGTKYRIEGD